MGLDLNPTPLCCRVSNKNGYHKSTRFCYIYDNRNYVFMKLKDLHYHILVKDGFDGEMRSYDIMPSLLGSIFNSNNTISKKKFYILDDKTYKRKDIKTKKDLEKFIKFHFSYHYHYKCEWEFIALDWPTCKDEGRPKKVDGYEQLEPNIGLITEIIWEIIKDKI